ncbi:hypothetical protein QWA_03260 [Alcaligenes faecalis subsp. faecalis NCIB 8687]|nr:hypothetical protein QWA_03260 [Alcaligenes faecalis subsp. faecalis NCIB 8687]
MSTETRLKPCPFCGGAAKEFERFNANVITCRRCGVKVRQSEMGEGDAAVRWNQRATPVAAQPDLTQQTLDDVMAGIPARDAEIEALRKEIETLRAQQPISGADGLRDQGKTWSGWACQYPGKLPRLYGEKDIAVANHHPEDGDRLIFLSAQQDADKMDSERWVSVNEHLPEIHEWRAGSIAGISDAVLTIDDDDPDTMTVQRLRKGGQGDLTTLYWDNGDSPTHWRPAPSLPGIDAARREQA